MDLAQTALPDLSSGLRSPPRGHLAYSLPYSSIRGASVGFYVSPPEAGVCHPPSRNCSTQHGAQRTCVEGGRTENHRQSQRLAFPSAAGVTGPGELSSGWLFTGTQLGITALVLWDLGVTNLKCPIINYKSNHLFNKKKEKRPHPQFFPLSGNVSQALRRGRKQYAAE